MKRRLLAPLFVLLASPRIAHAQGAPATTSEQDEDYAQTVTVRAKTWASPRGVGDVRVKRELIDASPRQQTSEMLSAAPGFFVDHEDAEGIGNDVYLRGFDLSHGSGVEMRLGTIPLNAPLHVQGQGYVDANFIIPEVVRSIRVLEGPYDPRQGDAAIVGSAYFDVGVAERGYHFKGSYGSFDQARGVAIVAPKGMNDETFAAFAARRTNGFGQNRASKSGSAMAQYAVDLGNDDRLKLTATAYGATARLAGVVRRDDVDAGRIGFDDSYPSLANGQGVDSTRVIVGADFDHAASGSHFEIAPWATWTSFRARRNYTGNLEIGAVDPTMFGLGDLYETRNREAAAGFTARHRMQPRPFGSAFELAVESGVTARAGKSEQQKALLRPADLSAWDRRLAVDLTTLDAGAWLDLDLRIAERLRLSGGPRVDLLAVSIDDRVGGPFGAARGASDVAVGPRATLAYEAWPGISPVLSYGEGFRSLNPDRLREGDAPYSKVRSGELGLRAKALHDRFVATAAVFETYVENELVFEAESGGLETQKASHRRGLVTSILAKPFGWLLLSSSLSITRSQFATLAPGISHYVPSIPSVLYRADATAKRTLGRIGGHAVVGRVGVGYTLLGRRHLSDTVLGATQNLLNASLGVRAGMIEVGLDGYNVLGLRYADDEALYASNWSAAPRPPGTQAPASIGRHITAAPPLALLASVTLSF